MRDTLLLALFLCTPLAVGEVLTVDSDRALHGALPKLKAGDTLRIRPGRYQPGLRLAALHGTLKQPITIEGSDPEDPPRFEGGDQAAHFVNCSHLTIRHLHIQGQKVNGLNLDDGGNAETPSHHIVLEHLQLSEIGPRGNHDAIKLSGLDDFTVRHCRFEGWAGQAIDMVGCHRGVIEHCVFLGKEGFAMTSGPQTKGGSADITIRHCRFENAGGRPLNLGGSTGLAYFRPPGAKYEARNITAHDNLIIGGMAAVAFTGLDGGAFHHNTIVHPDKWVFRVLQETTVAGFPPCRNVEFHHNLLVFQRSAVRGVANLGAGTDASSFKFHHNWWFASDAPQNSRPNLPADETDAVHGIDPKLAAKTYLPRTAEAKAYGRRPTK